MNDRDRILARFWSIRDKEYIYWDCYMQTAFNRLIEPNTYGLMYKLYKDRVNYIPEMPTGLRDKNGKLIYENDLIKCPSGIYRIAVDDFGLWTAIYKNNPFEGVGEWSDMVKEYAFNQNDVEIEVLGNIHENPELLEIDND